MGKAILHVSVLRREEEVVTVGVAVNATNAENWDILRENAHQMKIITETESA